MSASDFALPELGQPVAAAPGWFVLEPLRDDTGYPVEAHQEPVILWRCCKEFSSPYPITEEGVQTQSLFMLRPDGSVSRAFGEWFPSVDAWLKAQQQEYDEPAGQAVGSAESAAR